MKKFFVIFSIIIIPIIAYLGFHFYSIPEEIYQTNDTFAIQKKLQTYYPIQENHDFVFVILAENDAKISERQLKSIFDQTYPAKKIYYFDNGSTDETYEKAKAFCIKEGQEELVVLERMDEKKPDMQVIYECIHELDSQDVIVFLKGEDWLNHDHVLDHLNCSYANPDVWLTHSRSMLHPEYQKVEGEVYSDSFLIGKKFREKKRLPFKSLVTFYAGLFKEIRLEDLLFKGHFIDEKPEVAFLYPLLEMGHDHSLFVNEVMLVKSHKPSYKESKEYLQHLMRLENYICSLKVYPTLCALRLQPPAKHQLYKGDILIFSEDRPLHLYACLESLSSKVSDINDIYVIYQTHDAEFSRAYLNLKNEFSNVQFFDVCDYPENDFESLLKKVIANKRHSSPYLLLTEDLELWNDTISLHDCIDKMERIHADYFFVTNFGKQLKEEAIQVGNNIYVSQLSSVNHVKSPLLCLCRKIPLEDMLLSQSVENLEMFAHVWNKHLPLQTIALFYNETKSLPLATHDQYGPSQKKEWGRQFIEGYKMDLPSIFCEPDSIKEGQYPLIKRERYKLISRSSN